MKFPYGISDFKEIATQGYFYCDRTHMIPVIEDAGKSILFLRPRRFGKSLVLSMLENYYDVLKKDQFGKMFGHLKIGKNPTPLRNQYFILKLDFSCIGAYGSTDQLQQFMMDHINARVNSFITDYKDFIQDQITIHPQNGLASINSLLDAVKQIDRSIYLLIDEYDNFANELMLNKKNSNKDDHTDAYTLFVKKDGPLKTLFKALKAGTGGNGFDRTFITGVSPVVMSDITSGYNIAKNKYLDHRFHHLCGFTSSEVKNCLEKIVADCSMERSALDTASDLMKTYYNGYRFSVKARDYLYNPTLCLYFLEEFRDNCEFPRKMLDENLAVDDQKIEFISDLPIGEKIIAKLSQKNAILEISELKERFGIAELLKDMSKDQHFIISYLYYMGALTLGDESISGELSLKIPNLVIKPLYIDRIRNMLLFDPSIRDEGRFAAKKLYQTGDMQPLCDFIVDHYFKILSNRDYAWANELTVKTAFLTLLYNDILYIMDSETEIDRHYTDLTMIIRPDKRRFQIFDVLIEFKYISLKDAKLTGEAAKTIDQTALENMPCIKTRMAEAIGQAKQYSDGLNKKYPELRLKSFAVVALGFDRMCWKQMSSLSP
ncbi:MAG: AAA family ATPase [Candidatus Magnetomorum sp.]|nr:AAA family ATPase [Candidatus Magnetomorum sp.]